MSNPRARQPLPIIPLSYGRPIVEVERERAEAEARQLRFRSDDCPHCGEPAIDDQVTCGREACREHDDSRAAESAALKPAELPVSGGGS